VFDDAPFAGGERGDPGLCVAADADTCGREFVAGALGERVGAGYGGDVKAVAQRCACGSTVAAAA
jgi:hypothetical protein